MALKPFALVQLVVELANRELLNAKEVPEQHTSVGREDMLREHHYILVLLHLFEVNTTSCCQRLLVSPSVVIVTNCPVTVPASLLDAKRVKSNGTSC